VFITKMPVARIEDIARVMIKELAHRYGYKPEDIDTKVIGVKPGEKLYEELMSHEETRRSIELDKYFSVLPAFRGLYNTIDYKYRDVVNDNVTDPYISSEQVALTDDELRMFLSDNKLLDQDTIDKESPASRYWPGDKN